MATSRNTYARQDLLATLTPVERYSWDGLMDNARIAAWLGKHRTSVTRYRALFGFPVHDGHIPAKGRGGVPKPWRPRKGIPGWRAATVLAWLENTGRLAL